jgi:hypothetical protein
MTARITALPLAALASIAILAAACGGGTATTAPGSTGGPATQSAATQGPASTDGAEFSFDTSSFHADVQLESLFPKQIGGEDLTVLSMAGPDFLDGGAAPALEAALESLGKQASDVSVAFGGGPITIIAFKVNGVSGASILSAVFAAYTENDSTVTDANMGGKSVKKLTPPEGSSEDPTYVYAAQNVVFSVGGDSDTTDALLNEVFSKLP